MCVTHPLTPSCEGEFFLTYTKKLKGIASLERRCDVSLVFLEDIEFSQFRVAAVEQ